MIYPFRWLRPVSMCGESGGMPIIRPLGQEAKTSPSHGENVGSIPAGVTIRKNSVGFFVLQIFLASRRLAFRPTAKPEYLLTPVQRRKRIRSCRKGERKFGICGTSFRHTVTISIRPVGQAVKTRPFHGCNVGSIPARVTNEKDAFIVKIDGSFSTK